MTTQPQTTFHLCPRYASHFTCAQGTLHLCPRYEMRAQKPLIMQNEPKFPKAQMNASTVLTKDYDNWTLGERGKNEPKTNPKRTQTNPNAKKPK